MVHSRRRLVSILAALVALVGQQACTSTSRTPAANPGPRELSRGSEVETAPSPGELPAFGEYVYVEELPEAITKVPPIYPPEASKQKIQGAVMVQALVLKDGTVGDAKIVKSIPGLDEAAIASVRQWRFKPAMAKGSPVAVWVASPVTFSLDH